MFRSHVVRAVFRRNLANYFSGIIGYLFIVAFVVLGAFLAFQPRFFTDNAASLDHLNAWFPMMLLFIVPAITMSVWADEKKLGTDELLFTLPATDLEILIGKYLSVLAVYTIVLLFSVTHAIVLELIGNPDWLALLSTYFGYWLAGAALLSAGMVGSILTSSTTVAFVVGGLICAIPVFVESLSFQWMVDLGIDNLSIGAQLIDFGMGRVPLSNVLYFVFFTLFMLYINLVLISRRHWAGGADGRSMGWQYAVRVLCLGVSLISFGLVSTHLGWAQDLTTERLYSLSDTTEDLIDKIKKERPVVIQAFFSEEVPREFVAVKKRLLGILREYEESSSYISVRYVTVEPFSKESDEATTAGITPVRWMSERDGRQLEEDVFLGLVVTSTFDEVIVPFVGPGTPIEYELTRSIGTVSNEKRATVGILRTDADLYNEGGREWRIVTELKKQYEVLSVSADSPIDGDKYDVLIAAMPSSLTQPQMGNLVAYVRSGGPTLIFDDPYPYIFQTPFGVQNAPRQSKPRPGGMFGGGMQQPPEQKADGGTAASLMNVLQVAWDNGEILWDAYNPHPQFANIPPEFVFVSPNSGVRKAFSPDSEITSGLQEILAAFTGTIRPREDYLDDFEPLMRVSQESGSLFWDDCTTESFDPSAMQLTRRFVPNPRRVLDDHAHVVAAHITADDTNVVYVADIDLVSDWFFQTRERAQINFDLDNVTFVLNAVDVLADDETFLTLRKRRDELRTLQWLEEEVSQFQSDLQKALEDAEKDANDKLADARKRLQEQVEKIEKNAELSDIEKAQRVAMMRNAEQERLNVEETRIQQQKQREIDRMKSETERKKRAKQDQIRYLALFIPPIPAVVLGILVLVMRLYREQENINPERRAR